MKLKFGSPEHLALLEKWGETETNVRVIHMTKQGELFYSCTPREAVIAAYAQYEKKDWNTWDYEKKYGSLVLTGNLTVSCGDFVAWRNPNRE